MKHKSFRQRFIRIQKKAYQRASQQIAKSFKHDSKIKQYQKEYEKYVKKYEKVISWGEIFRKMIQAKIIYQGDYHTLKQSQKCIKYFIDKLLVTRKICLCLEIFRKEHQKYIELFLKNQMTVKQLFLKTGYHVNWGFQWKTWAELMTTCRKRNISVVGLDVPAGHHYSLKERDQFAAEIIAKQCIRMPDHLIFVVMGDFHIAPPHLPHEVDKILPSQERLMIYQNAEGLYWQLADAGLEDSSLLQINRESFCVMNSTPAHKWQSYLNWLESSDESFYPSPQALETQHDSIHGFSTIQQMVEYIAGLLNIDLPIDPFKHLHIYYAHHMHFTQTMYEDPCFRTILPLIEKKMLLNEAFLLESPCGEEMRYVIFLPSPSINMASEEAAHFLNAILRGPLLKPKHGFDRFYRNVMLEALGFLGSKLVNPKRRIFTLSDLRRMVFKLKRKLCTREESQNLKKAQFILRHLYLENQSGETLVFQKRFKDIFAHEQHHLPEFSTQLGHLLGNKLFLALKKDRLPVAEVKNLFYLNFEEPGSAFREYIRWSQTLKKLNAHEGFSRFKTSSRHKRDE